MDCHLEHKFFLSTGTRAVQGILSHNWDALDVPWKKGMKDKNFTHILAEVKMPLQSENCKAHLSGLQINQKTPGNGLTKGTVGFDSQPC